MPRPKKTPLAAVDTEPAAEKTGRFYDLQTEVAYKGPYRLTEDLVFPVATRKLMKQFNAAESDEDKMQVLCGGRFGEVEALFDDRPLEEWMAFQRDLYAHYFGMGALDLPGGSQGS